MSRVTAALRQRLARQAEADAEVLLRRDLEQLPAERRAETAAFVAGRVGGLPSPMAAGVGAVGSSNMDIRSFSLNYESSLFIAEGSLLDALSDLASNYLAVSHELTLEVWAQRPWHRRYIDNVMKLTSALQ